MAFTTINLIVDSETAPDIVTALRQAIVAINARVQDQSTFLRYSQPTADRVAFDRLATLTDQIVAIQDAIEHMEVELSKGGISEEDVPFKP